MLFVLLGYGEWAELGTVCMQSSPMAQREKHFCTVHTLCIIQRLHLQYLES